jgi:tRNA-dihydrouridine synthase
MFTIEQVAEKIGVSKITIYNKLNKINDKLKEHVYIKDNTTMLDNDAVKIIKDSINPNKFKTKKEQIKGQDAKEDIFLLKVIDQMQKHIDELRSDKEKLFRELEEQREIYKKELEDQRKLHQNTQVLLQQAQQQALLIQNQQEKELRKDKKGFWKKIFNVN